MRTLVTLGVLAIATPAAADNPVYRLVEDAALGIELPADHRLLDDAKAADALANCVATTPPTGSAVFFVELSRTGAVTQARVHGSGKPVLDRCLGGALKKLVAADKLTAAIGVVGRLDLAAPGQADYLDSPRVSSAAVMIAPHDAIWQLTVNRVGYTSNRAQDIAQALDGQSAAIAKCATRRSAKGPAAEGLAWIAGGKAAFQSGNGTYDRCVTAALGRIKLPAADSALWMHVAIMKPAEPLAPRTTKAGLSKADLLRDALTTAVRSRKAALLGCVDGKPKAALTKVGVALRGGKASVVKVSTGNTDADACVRNKFRDVAIASAAAGDKVELEISLEPEL